MEFDLITVFKTQDGEYLKWIHGHKDGLVLNTKRIVDSRYMVLHRGDCTTITPNKAYRPGQFAERDYIKVCADSVSELEGWVSRHGRADGTFSLECRRCGPRAPLMTDG